MLKFINSARGIAIILVVILHCSFLYKTDNAYFRKIFDYGNFGVQLFFVVSAYTLCFSFDRRKEEAHSVLNFYIRRFFRIFPMYYLGIGIYYILSSIFKITEAFTAKNVLANVFFVHGFVPSANNTIVPGGWSVGTEMLFYLIFPLLHWFLFSGKMLMKAILIVAASIGTMLLLNVNIEQDRFWFYNIILQLPVFICGIVFYKYNEKLTEKVAMILFLVFSFLTMLLWSLNIHLLVPLFCGFSFCGLVRLIQKGKLNFEIFQKMGVVSYSVYITHFIFAYYLLPETDYFLVMVFYIIFTLILCYFMGVFLEKYVEKPFIKLGSKLINKLSKNG